jgi:hypothetical protein
MLSKIGKIEVSKEEIDDYELRIKDRNQIIEKNKKLRTLKKPEAFVPVIDPLSEKDGVIYIYKNKNMQFINLMENRFEVEVIDVLRSCVSKAIDLMFSLERNKVKFENMEKLRMLNGHKIYM